MDIVIIALVALIASGLTLFSGFGLGTLLMPVIALFFPIDIAIAMTAIVHFANNLFKVGLLGQKANQSVLIAFGIPAIIFSVLGAVLLHWLSGAHVTFSYSLFQNTMQVSLLKFVIGLVILAFVLLELIPAFANMAFDKKYLPLGGLLSGFFGGLSGHQGVFRSMFLIKAGLSKEQFVATGVILAVMVDISRMLIYGLDAFNQETNVDWYSVIAACFSAFVGAYVGSRLLDKVTIIAVQRIVSLLLMIVAIGMMTGLL